ncbi:MAG TPA: ArsI/CadI family heavy metal resistance metalloenzyme [Vicinamibacteria bacterium]|nr:ArsI/CadI family heavy metal resistance metalloenzyme [Vicinamibacteria bacterium]
MKTHLALNTAAFDRSVDFYRRFFGSEPVKLKPGYAKFELEEPGLNFTLNASVQPLTRPGAVNHLGIEVSSAEDVQAAAKRLREAGFETLEEPDVECCYAIQDKVWVTDPNGHRWEVFVVKQQNVGIETPEGVAAKAACAPGCC